MLAVDLARGALRVVLDTNAPRVPELFLYSPNRAQVLPAFRAFVDIAREGASARKANA